MNALRILWLVLALVGGSAVAQPLALPAPPQAGLAQHPGAQLPLALPLVAADGRALRLGDLFAGGRPVLIVPGYYSCPRLCGMLMQGLLETVHEARLRVRIVRVSIDPQDTPATARAARTRDLAYARFLGGPAPDLHLLVGTAANTAALANAIGYQYQAVRDADDPAARIAHPAAVIVATPQGRVSRYLMGVRFDPAELRAAVAGASQGEVGTLTQRLALLCAHFDPRVGRYSAAVMSLLRGVGLLTVAALAGWCWRRRRPGADR